MRNLGGIGDQRLFNQCFTGTKVLIEEYNQEVSDQLVNICENEYPGLTNSQKLDLFNETRQSFGHTALLLEGGATFGLCHLGVVKALWQKRLLPRIICGSSVGALIAALVCIHNDDELPSIFLPGGIDLRAFTNKGQKGSITRKISRFLKHGYLMDVKVIEDCVRSNLGDITFEEAFQKTHKVLNITVSSSRKDEVPRLLNYLTAPNVLIRSAACASVSAIGLYRFDDLLAKDQNGYIFVWNPSTVKWSTAYQKVESPEKRISELFNVNHFILSQASPYIAPFVASNKFKNDSEAFSGKLFNFITSEVKHRVNQSSELGIVPGSVQSLFGQKSQGHVTIAPQLSSKV